MIKIIFAGLNASICPCDVHKQLSVCNTQFCYTHQYGIVKCVAAEQRMIWGLNRSRWHVQAQAIVMKQEILFWAIEECVHQVHSGIYTTPYSRYGSLSAMTRILIIRLLLLWLEQIQRVSNRITSIQTTVWHIQEDYREFAIENTFILL